MNSLCRICLVDASEQEITNLTKELLHKISVCFGYEITLCSDLPHTVCKECDRKIEDIHLFRQKVIKNQNILLKKSDVDFQISKNNYIEINYEHVKSENNSPCKEHNIISNNNEKIDQNMDISERVYNDPVKTELTENIEKYDSGDDDTYLSVFKNSKENDLIHNQNNKPSYSNDDKVIKQFGSYTNFTCLTCLRTVSSQTELIKHYNEEHKIEEKLNGKDFFAYDVIKIDGLLQYKCTLCSKTFDNKRNANRHKISHIDDRPFLCKLCGRTYKTASEIVRHGRVHSGVKIPCRYKCGYSTVYMGALKEHERRHRTEYAYTCEKCGKGFQVKTWYEQHQNIHKGLKPFVCEICGVGFHMDKYLKVHLTSVHLQSSSRNRFVCVHCSKLCDSKKSLTVHLKEHGITTKFLCDICGKVLSDSGQLSLHKKVHLNDRPYSCSDCGKSFVRRCNLSRHELTHTAERKHGCPKCERSYSQRATMRRHLRRFHKGNADSLEDKT